MIRIEDEKMCCGCSACIASCPVDCIAWTEDGEGFLYPVADATVCIGCGRCERVCPMLNPLSQKEPEGIFAARNLDEDIRYLSSSGGVFSLLATSTIEAGGVVFGACFDRKWNVRHAKASTSAELEPMRGSKYLQSRMEDTFRSAEAELKDGKKVLFTGTSCQIAGLRNFLGKDYPNLLAADVVCHSIPSPKVWQQYLYESVGGDAIVTGVTFRDKSLGWRNFSLVVRGKETPEWDPRILLSQTTQENPYMRGFLKGLFSRPACAQCPAKCFASGADLTIADFWGADEFYPEQDDNWGLTLTFILTGKGRKAFDSLGAVSFPITPEQATAHNPRIMSPSRPHPHRKDFFAGLGKEHVEDMVRKYTKRTFAQKVKRRIGKILGKR